MFLANFNTNDNSRPSFFELFAQEQLIPTLKPAIEYLLSVFAVRYRTAQIALNFSDEIFSSLTLALNSYFIFKYDAFFAENFYSLKRVVVSEASTIIESPKDLQNLNTSIFKPLTTRTRFISLIYSVLLPYIKAKIDRKLLIDDNNNNNHITQQNLNNEELNFVRSFESQPEANRNENNRQQLNYYNRMKKNYWFILRKLWRILSAFTESWFLVYQILYMFDHQRYFTPILHLQHITLQRLSAEELQEQLRASKLAKRSRWHLISRFEAKIQKLSFTKRVIARILIFIAKWCLRGMHWITDYISHALPFAIFIFTLLEWWYANENRLMLTEQLPIPLPPEPIQQAAGGIPIATNKLDCSICNKKRSNSAALTTSGLVFCYSCIHSFIEKNGYCPVTLIPTSVEQIVRLYDEFS
eukprot:TRINITY_DN849_c0_g1_i1.p1 TRINITY_DN849_c0_g1~~TRINITY_DN849_c0_g1_i1.p1  ORF type:complete len:413 (-),score=129.50 TRINITY_DN849_c0_g1_i1:21-1259(-)